MDEDSPNPYGACCMRHAARGVPEQRAPYSASLVSSIDRQPSQYRNRNGIRHVPPEPPWNGRIRDSSRSQCIVADDVRAFADHIGPGRAA